MESLQQKRRNAHLRTQLFSLSSVLTVNYIYMALLYHAIATHLVTLSSGATKQLNPNSRDRQSVEVNVKTIMIVY